MSTENNSPPCAVEVLKANSRQLRGTLAEELATDDSGFGDANKQLLKFHGLYQQHNRELRGKDVTANFMIRSRIPAGILTAEQYLVHDDLASRYTNGTLRITTRQVFQLHGVLKGDIRATLRAINRALLTTQGACGDVVRNVILSPIPARTPAELAIADVARELSAQLLPGTTAYHEIWLDGEKLDFDADDEAGREAASEAVLPAALHSGSSVEPLYGDTYLPRKFKIGIAVPGDNSADVFAQDVGLIADVDADGELRGFVVLVGGGMGMTHKKPNTFPRLADAITFATRAEVGRVVEAIVAIQRDFGDRSDRRHARLKYLLHDWGIDRFRAELARRLGREILPPPSLPPLKLNLFHGWHRQADGRWFVGLFVENGRVKDAGETRLKSGLRAVVEKFRPTVRLTPHQDLILADMDDAAKPAIEAALAAHGIRTPDAFSIVRRHSMACPALPTCGLAITDAERALPGVIDDLEFEVARLGLGDEVITVRMTGCPNGCARPYVADIGLVGRSREKYTVFLGGRSDGTRLNREFADLVAVDEIVPRLLPLLEWFRDARREGESFGDFCDRIGIDALRNFADESRAIGAGSGRLAAVGAD